MFLSTGRKRKKLVLAVLSVVVMATVFSILPVYHTSESMETRLQRMRGVCNLQSSSNQTQLPHGGRSGIFFNEEHRLAYCVVPKAGCTFWKRTMAFLNNDTKLKTPVHTPFDIPRMYIHLYRHTGGHSWVKVKDKVEDHFRFMFSRDPYSRLWSSYVDKFFLPDFWTMMGTKLMKKKNDSSRADRVCGSNVSFPDFINFTLHSNEPHWTPVSTLCDPCVFRPHLLGKMDTFHRDARTVLDQADLAWILDGVDHRRYVQLELETLVLYNLRDIFLKLPRLYKCISGEHLGFRLWKTFQWNGYILDSISYQPPSPFTVESFKLLALEASARSMAVDKERLRKQKKDALENAFRQLSLNTLHRIVVRYEQDFKMFGYKPRYFRDGK